MEEIKYKICSQCSINKEENITYFEIARYGIDGKPRLTSKCRNCLYLSKQERIKNNKVNPRKDKTIYVNENYKFCSNENCTHGLLEINSSNFRIRGNKNGVNLFAASCLLCEQVYSRDKRKKNKQNKPPVEKKIRAQTEKQKSKEQKKIEYSKFLEEKEEIKKYELKYCNGCETYHNINNFTQIKSGRYKSECKKYRNNAYKKDFDDFKYSIKYELYTVEKVIDMYLDYKENIRKIKNSFRKLNANIGRDIRNLVKDDLSKSITIRQSLPFTKEEFTGHIEAQFKLPGNEWMSWSNWGVYRKELWNNKDKSTWKWQLDHIIPNACFTYDNLKCDDFKACWSLENLRPYSAKKNHEDGNTKIRHIQADYEKYIEEWAAKNNK